MSCFLSAVLAYPLIWWVVVCALLGLGVFVVFSIGYFCRADRFCDRGPTRGGGA